MTSVTESSQAASVIEVTSSQQTQGVGQAAEAMTSIDKAMQQIAEGASQLHQSSSRLTNLNREIAAMVEGYQV
jgi:methyl-accepting chemotaxis protein